MKKVCIIALAVLLNSFSLLAIAKEADDEAHAAQVGMQTEDSYIEGCELYNKAYVSYFTAKNSDNFADAAAQYVEGIGAISRANKLNENNIPYLMLASQLYRGRGVIPYATSYCKKALAIAEEKMKALDNDDNAELNYAIIAYAGDVRYTQEKELYSNLAKDVAKNIVSDNRAENEAIILRKALAYLILEDNKESHMFFEKLPDNSFYRKLFNTTLARNQWLWPSAEKNLGAEFLLYYLGDLSKAGL